MRALILLLALAPLGCLGLDPFDPEVGAAQVDRCST